jgi:hypothetical protein
VQLADSFWDANGHQLRLLSAREAQFEPQKANISYVEARRKLGTLSPEKAKATKRMVYQFRDSVKEFMALCFSEVLWYGDRFSKSAKYHVQRLATAVNLDVDEQLIPRAPEIPLHKVMSLRTTALTRRPQGASSRRQSRVETTLPCGALMFAGLHLAVIGRGQLQPAFLPRTFDALVCACLKHCRDAGS